MRSCSGTGMPCSVFAVRDEHHVGQVVVEIEVVIVEGVVLLGVEHLEQRRRRDRRGSRSTSCRSRRAGTPGCCVPAFFSDWMILPGSAPMYVRRWPRISASSRTPPSDRRTNLRPVARAIDLRERRLADAGRPDEAEDRALELLHQRLHREVLEDALLDLLQAVVVLVEDLLGLVDVVACPRSCRTRAARGSSRCSCARRSPPRSSGHHLELLQLLLDLRAWPLCSSAWS